MLQARIHLKLEQPRSFCYIFGFCNNYLFGDFKITANLINTNSTKSTGTWDHRELSSRCWFVLVPSTFRNEQCADRPIVSI